ncbi:MAG: hypothetical protein ACP5QU_05470 [Anaerolineae bacterium]
MKNTDPPTSNEKFTLPTPEAAKFIESMGIYFENEGVSRIGGRILGLLLIAHKPLSGEEIAEILSSEDEDMILIGNGLAKAMAVQVGDRITLVGSDVHKQNRRRTMTVVGIYDIGLPTNEKRTVYISLGEAQSLVGLPGQATEVQITLKNVGREADVVAAMAPAREVLVQVGEQVQAGQTLRVLNTPVQIEVP